MKTKKLRSMNARVLYPDKITLKIRDMGMWDESEAITITVDNPLVLKSMGYITAVYDSKQNILFVLPYTAKTPTMTKQLMAFCEDFTKVDLTFSQAASYWWYLKKWERFIARLTDTCRAWRLGQFATVVPACKYMNEIGVFVTY